MAGRVENAQDRCKGHLEHLGRDQDPPPIDPIGGGPAQEHEREQRRIGREAAVAEIAGIDEPGVDEPVERQILGPGA
jgi:hypothetical protein